MRFTPLHENGPGTPIENDRRGRRRRRPPKPVLGTKDSLQIGNSIVYHSFLSATVIAHMFANIFGMFSIFYIVVKILIAATGG